MNDWILRGQHINELQQASIARVVKRCKQAHFTNLDIRINGKNEAEEADWVKWLEPVTVTTNQHSPEREARALLPCPRCDGLGYHTISGFEVDCKLCNRTGRMQDRRRPAEQREAPRADERAAFEAWWAEKWGDYVPVREGTGYVNKEASLFWMVWQAARAEQPAAPASPVVVPPDPAQGALLREARSALMGLHAIVRGPRPELFTAMDAIKKLDAALAAAAPPPDRNDLLGGQGGRAPAAPATQRQSEVAEPKDAVCTWSENGDGAWDTGCGQCFVLNDGGPADNDMRFCCYCGKTLVQWEYQESAHDGEAP